MRNDRFSKINVAKLESWSFKTSEYYIDIGIIS